MKKYLLTLPALFLCFLGYTQAITFGSIPNLCADEAPKNLTTLSNASVSGGIWKCLNCNGFNPITNNETFNPAARPTGFTYEFRYVHAASMDSAEITLKVNRIPTVNAGTTDDNVCESEAQVLLSSSPSGGQWSGAGISTSQNTFYPGNAGVVKGGNNKLIYNFTDPVTGCRNKDSVEIFVQKAPTIDITPAEPYIRCKNEKFYISSNRKNAPTGIIWSAKVGDTAGISPSRFNSQITYTPNQDDITNGSVTLVVQTLPFLGDQCPTAEDEINLTIDTCTATSVDLIEDTDITLYPNPSSDKVTLTKQGNMSYDVSLVNAGGRLLQNYNWDETSKQLIITREKLPNGIYYLILTNKVGHQWYKKIIFD